MEMDKSLTLAFNWSIRVFMFFGLHPDAFILLKLRILLYFFLPLIFVLNIFEKRIIIMWHSISETPTQCVVLLYGSCPTADYFMWGVPIY